MIVQVTFKPGLLHSGSEALVRRSPAGGFDIWGRNGWTILTGTREQAQAEAAFLVAEDANREFATNMLTVARNGQIDDLAGRLERSQLDDHEVLGAIEIDTLETETASGPGISWKPGLYRISCAHEGGCRAFEVEDAGAAATIAYALDHRLSTAGML